jgi:hypothetical protein
VADRKTFKFTFGFGFYFPHMKYFFIANFHVLGLFMPKKQVKSEKKNPSVTWRCGLGVGRNLYRRYLSRLKGYRFEILAILRQLSWIDAPHTQNFEIFKFLE